MATHYHIDKNAATGLKAGCRMLSSILAHARWESYPSGVCGHQDGLSSILEDAGFINPVYRAGYYGTEAGVIFAGFRGCSPAQKRRAVAAIAAHRNQQWDELAQLGYDRKLRRI